MEAIFGDNVCYRNIKDRYQNNRLCCKNDLSSFFVVKLGHWMYWNCCESWLAEMLFSGASYKLWARFHTYRWVFSTHWIDFWLNQVKVKNLPVIRNLIKTLAQSRSFPSASIMSDTLTLTSLVSIHHPLPSFQWMKMLFFQSVWKSHESTWVWHLWGFVKWELRNRHWLMWVDMNSSYIYFFIAAGACFICFILHKQSWDPIYWGKKFYLCSIQEARGSTQAVTAPMVKHAWTTGSGWKSTAWTISRTSVYLYK